MMKKSVLVVSLVCLLGAPWCAASPDLSGDAWQLSLRKDGTIEQLASKAGAGLLRQLSAGRCAEIGGSESDDWGVEGKGEVVV